MGKYKVSTDTYFIANPQGLVKIGRTNNVQGRLYQLQCQLGESLTLLAAIPKDIEYRLHEKFFYLRTERRLNDHNSREWFKPDDALLTYIENLKCAPVTWRDLRRAEKTLWKSRISGDHRCNHCNERIPWFYLKYPHFQGRYEQFYQNGDIICPSCYHYWTSGANLADRIVQASLQRQPDFGVITVLLCDLHTPAPVGA